MDYHEKRRAGENLAIEMKSRGWTLFGYTPYKPAGPGDDYGDLGYWHGCATHERFPGVVVVVNTRSDLKVAKEGCPTYQANRKGKFWHIEALGTIWVQGTGFAECASYNDKSGVKHVADNIEHNAAQIYQSLQKGREARSETGAKRYDPTNQITTLAGATIWQSGDWTWVRFPLKPTDEILSEMRKLGGDWHRKEKAWYFKTTAVRPHLEALLL
jgi:hypothetical protein